MFIPHIKTGRTAVPGFNLRYIAPNRSVKWRALLLPAELFYLLFHFPHTVLVQLFFIGLNP
jgi:hypothetical protein